MSIMWVLLLLVPLLVGAYEECSPACQLPPMSCNYIDYPVYTPGLDFAVVEANVSSLLSLATLVKNAGYTQCYESILPFVCAYFYPSCNNVTNQEIRPCLSMCSTTNTNCALLQYYPEIPPSYLAILNCSATDENGIPIWDQSNSNCFVLTNTNPICASVNTSNDDVDGNCETYSTEQTPNTASVCSHFVSDEIFVPNTVSQSFLDTAVNSSLLWLIQRIYPIMPVGCYKSILSLLCQTAFPSCSRVNASGTEVTIPSYPCRSLCEQTNNECAEFFSLVNQTLFNCSSTDLFSGKQFAQWPEGPNYTLKTNGGIESTTTCEANLFAENSKLLSYSPPDVESCPFPMAKKPNPGDGDSPCWIPCPDPTYSHKQWDELIFIGHFFSSISFVLMVFMVTSALLDSNKRKFPANIHIYELACAGLISVAFFMNGSNPKENVWCVDAVTFANTHNNATCGAQGFLFMLFNLCTLTWWLVLSFNMFVAVTFELTKELSKFKIYYHLFAWGIPLIFSIAVLAKGGFGYTAPASWCFITGETAGLTVGGESLSLRGLDFALFYFPILVGITLAVIFLIVVFAKIWVVSRATRNITSKGNANASLASQAQKRIMTLVVFLVILFALVFEYRMALNNAVSEEFKEVDFAWGLCKIKQQLNIPDPGTCPGETPPKVFSYNHSAFITFLCSSIGIVMFIIFGTDKRIYALWIFFFKCAKNGRWDSIKMAVKDCNTISDSMTSTTNISRSGKSGEKGGGVSGGESGGTPLALRRSGSRSFVHSESASSVHVNDSSSISVSSQV